jgi:hypothetical protein
MEKRNLNSMACIVAISYLALLCGCFCSKQSRVTVGRDPLQLGPRQVNFGKYWHPSKSVEQKAGLIAARYAVGNLAVSRRKLAQLGRHYEGIIEDGKKLLSVTFYNPLKYTPTAEGSMSPVLRGFPDFGGFPDYFVITVDTDRWEVTEHYAPPE